MKFVSIIYIIEMKSQSMTLVFTWHIQQPCCERLVLIFNSYLQKERENRQVILFLEEKEQWESRPLKDFRTIVVVATELHSSRCQPHRRRIPFRAREFPTLPALLKTFVMCFET